MDSLIQTVVFLGYLDSLFSEGRAREVTPLRAVPETLNRLHADAMREHARRSALLVREDAGWNPVPDWRLDRQVIRVGLYLRERLGVEPGQRVALLGELRPEWLIADLATLGLGAVSVAIDPRLQRADLTAALEDAAPRVTFVSSAALRMLESLDGRTPPHGQLIALGPAATGSSVTTLQVLLEMGGTLDTPERAQSYRADARSFAPDRPAVRHYREAPDGGWERVDLSQGEVIERLRGGWPREPSRSGDVAYVCDPTISPAARLALYAFLGDGCTTTALAPVDWELSDLAALRPTKIVAPAALLAEAVRAGLARAEEPPASDGGWVRQAARLVPLARESRDRRAIRDTLGGRARWIGSTDRLDAALAERLGSIAVVWPLRN
jgi:long-subunit acyl-CoA synthetase (AMP-forming)